jgi:hypothetical protein
MGRCTNRIIPVVTIDRGTAANPGQAFARAYYSHMVER